ncbi:pseudouridine synthase [Paenibacillus swuensis]|uniref:Pseudouridine synthase n=1 Tax=Paenibacillus swuensis TaxID=1178515 RepID=A0A172TNP3_9BACL|nr:RluA family pseudouridine synthase [Paenibacillus swuensis]ANE48596.1 pseudouridine synthase [Paenibacillus swuensis]
MSTFQPTGYYKPLIYEVSADEEGMLLRTIMHQRMHISRKLTSHLKQTEYGILLNGERVYINVKVSAGDRVEIRMEEEISEDILPQEMPLQILYEDEHLLMMNKQAGIIVHPTHGHYTNTLANGIVHYWQSKGERVRFRPIHRLDQETSGVLAIAKNPWVHQHVSEQMIAGEVEKLYLAVVYGCPPLKAGTVQAPIDRDAEQPHLRVVTPAGTGYDAITHYETVKTYGPLTLVRLRLETGRTHQIRVHMKYLGCPLIGDKMYIDHQYQSLMQSMEGRISRHALHAERLSFKHPVTAERMVFTAPLPDDLKHLLSELDHE